MRRVLALALALASVAACGPSDGSTSASGSPARRGEARGPAGPARSPAPATAPATANPTPQASPGRALSPAPDARLPAGAPALAVALGRATRSVRLSVETWTRDGDPGTWPPPRDLVLAALYQQRIYRLLAQHPALASRVLRALPGSVRREAGAVVRAVADIFAQANPVPPSYGLRTHAPEPAGALLGYFHEAERRFGVPWEVLAAVAYVETKFGRVVSNSSAGAQGPMQFLPPTWAAYGLGGDVRDAHDAILGAANYLHANGAPENIRGALYHYNPVPEYVDAVATYAHVIRHDPRLYYAMYCWQVYVLTTRGDRRVTGPGL